MNFPSLSQSQLVQFQRACELHVAGKLTEAASMYEALLQTCPDHPQALSNLGTIALQSGLYDQAAQMLGRSLALDPNQPEMLSNFGIALQSLGRLQESLGCFDLAVMLKPDYAEAHNNRGNVYKDLGQPEQALACYRQAASLNPCYAEAFYNQGIALQAMDQLDGALAAYDRSLALQPEYAEAYSNRGNVLKDLNRIDEALASYGKAIQIKPGFTSPLWNTAMCKLLQGDFEAGWRLYEYRWDEPGRGYQQQFFQPLWLGESPLEGKRLLVYAEQGLGDFIQFCRYVPLLEAQGANVILEVPPPLVSLVKTLQGRFTLVEAGSPLPEFDLQCPIMSLPLACKTTLATIPAQVPYLHVDESKRRVWRERLGEPRKKRVGLVWSGSSAHGNDRNRSLPFAALASLLDLPVEFHSLQKEIREEDAENLRNEPRIVLHHEALHDFSDTAALIHQMDLVISVDTSVAHLAGALGRPLWLLLSYAPDFRWMLGRSDSVWYPFATLFRQTSIGDWGSVMGHITQALKQNLEQSQSVSTEQL
jgi:tetratricopeptide (TPR) repeat protein